MLGKLLHTSGIVLQALAKDPKDRFSSVQAFAAALEVASALPPRNPAVVAPTVWLPSWQAQPAASVASPILPTTSVANTPASLLPPLEGINFLPSLFGIVAGLALAFPLFFAANASMRATLGESPGGINCASVSQAYGYFYASWIVSIPGSS